jgi:hypothetical protein
LVEVTRLRWLLASGVLLAGPAAAQTTGSIEGRLTDSAGGALAGAAVTASSPQLQGRRTAVTDVAGQFRFPAVPPGEYVVRAEREGFRASERAATVRLDATARLDFVLEPLVAADVLVSGEAPRMDFASTTTGTSYTSDVVSHLPVGRDYADIVRANPGVSTDRGDTQGRALALTIYGATSAENRWIIDGVDTTNTFKGTQGKAINNEFVQEVEVKTGGYEAEYGGALGGVVNVITKSGGNAYHGDAFVYYDAIGTTASVELQPGDVDYEEMRIADGRRLDFGADLGGFLVKDRLWIFGAFNRVDLDGHVARLESSTHVSSEDQFPFDSAESLYSGKLTWNLDASTSAVGSVFADPSRTSGAAGADPRQGLGAVFVEPIVSPDPSTWFSTRDQGGTDFGVRLTRLFGSSAIATLAGGYHRDRNALTAPEGIRTEDWTCVQPATYPCDRPPEPNSVTGGYGRIGGFTDHSTSHRQQYRADVTLYGGNHEIKTGADYASGRTDAVGSFTGGQLVIVADELGQRYYEHNFIAVSGDDLTPTDIFRGGAVRDYGAFLQDSWRPALNLTVNVGLRFDGEDAADVRGDTALRLRTAWQPRIGVVWDPWKDGATKVYASVGRFSYALPTAQAANLFSTVTSVVVYNFDPVSLEPDSNVPGKGSGRQVFGGSSAALIDSRVVSPYQDELTLGIERALGTTWTVGLKGTYRRLGSMLENRCDIDTGDGTACAVITPGSNGRYASGDAPICNGLDDPFFDCADPGPATPPARRIYRGIELLARKTVADRLWIQASYVYSSLRGNYDGGVNQITGRTVPGANQDFDYPALSHDAYGRLFLDRPHKFRLDGYWVTPWRLSLGVQAFVESGAPLNRLGYFSVNYGSLVFLVPRGSEGRLPTLWDTNLTLSYPIAVGPVTVTLQAYLFHAFNKQIAISHDEVWSSDPPGDYPASLYDPNQPKTNGLYGAVTGRSDPRTFRAAVRVSF